MTRIVVRFAAVSCIAAFLAGCGGGASSPALPRQPQSVAQAPIQPVGEEAVRGIAVALHLPLRNGAALDALIARQSDRHSADYHRYLTPEQFRAQFGPPAADLTTAATVLKELGFGTRVTSQTVLASAPQATVERAFNVRLRTVTERGKTALAADRRFTIPAALARLGATVSVANKVMQTYTRRTSLQPLSLNRYSSAGPYWFDDLKEAYGYPSYQRVDGRGRTIAVVESSDILDSDTALYFGHEGLGGFTVQRRPVDGGPAAFDPNSGAAAEADLDVQQALGSAPGAHVVLYGTPDLSDASVYHAYLAAIEDNTADVVSSSFGLCELDYTAAYNGGTDYTYILQQFHDAFRQGNAQGITFVTASGDDGANGCLDATGSYIVKGVTSFADDPSVVGVGGTNLVTDVRRGSLASRYVREDATFDPLDPARGALPNQIFGSGGGISQIFAKPSYQSFVRTGSPMRTVPDVAMHMGGCPVGALLPCPADRSSDVVAIGGQFYAVVGTSAAAPEFAGLLAVTEQRLGVRLGNANNYIYVLSAVLRGFAYHQDITGNNGYPATPGYNYVVGNGTPRAAAFALDPFAPEAGTPQTPSNP